MSYIKNCKTCGQRISLREMQRGQWVAFDANTDIPHKHNKKNKAEKRPSYDYDKSSQVEENDSLNYKNTRKTEEVNIWPYIIIGIIIIIIIYN